MGRIGSLLCVFLWEPYDEKEPEACLPGFEPPMAVIVGLDAYGLQYAVIPTFRDWKFPHGGLPDSWSPPAGNANDHSDFKLNRRVLSNNYEGVKNAHFVPREEQEWFERETMTEAYTGGIGIYSDMNRMWLRAELHRIYDSHNFAIVPKKDIFDTDEPQSHPQTYVVHFLGPSVGEFWNMYHNVPVQHIDDTRAELHLARFAWAIIIHVKGFLFKDHPRTMVRVPAADGEQKTETLAGSTLTELYGGEGSLYASPLNPRKRRKGDGDVEEEEGRSGRRS